MSKAAKKRKATFGMLSCGCIWGERQDQPPDPDDYGKPIWVGRYDDLHPFWLIPCDMHRRYGAHMDRLGEMRGLSKGLGHA